MAKIKARGDREVARWEGESGKTVVLTAKGRLLLKLASYSNYTVVKTARPRWDRPTAERYASERGMREVAVRR